MQPTASVSILHFSIFVNKNQLAVIPSLDNITVCLQYRLSLFCIHHFRLYLINIISCLN